MADAILGAKSKLYIKEHISGITESSDTLQHVTAQEIAGNRVGLDTVIHGVYKTHVPPKLIEAGSVKRLIKITAHGARKGDVLKINNGAAVGEEVAIVKVEDADTLVIATEINAAIGDEVFIMRHITPLYDKNGNLSVITTTSPTQYVLNGVDQKVVEDTVSPANNRAFPSKMFIKKDGQQLPVTKDTGTPSNTVSVPVDVVSGANQLGVNASGEALVHDEGLLQAVRSGIKETAKTGSFDEKLAFVAVQTFVAPAGAVSANIMNVGAANIRYKQGAVATTTSGLRLEPGRSEQILNGSNISLISEDGASSCDVAIIWNVQP